MEIATCIQNETVNISNGSIAEFKCQVDLDDCLDAGRLRLLVHNETYLPDDLNNGGSSPDSTCSLLSRTFRFVYVDVDIKNLTCVHEHSGGNSYSFFITISPELQEALSSNSTTGPSQQEDIDTTENNSPGTTESACMWTLTVLSIIVLMCVV